MRYQLRIAGDVLGEVEADNDTAGVDAARKLFEEEHLAPEGGHFDLEVFSPDTGTQLTSKGIIPRPPGVVSTFSVHHPPVPELAEEIKKELEAKEKEYAEADRYDGWLDSLVADGTLTEEQAAPKRRLPPEERARRDAQRKARRENLAERHDVLLNEMVEAGALSHAESKELRKRITPRLAKETEK